MPQRNQPVTKARRRKNGRRYLTAAIASGALLAGGGAFAFAEGEDTAKPDTRDAGTLCGASFMVEPDHGDENYQDAFDRLDADYGLESVRVFYPDLPAQWPGKLDAGELPMTVSFKTDPAQILAGEHDDHFTRWFAEAPTDRDIYWTYFHEPEDNIESGEFTASDYRDAWAHLVDLAEPAGNPRLQATLILMGWTLEPGAGRQWRDYFPGTDTIDVLAWDSYNQIKPDPTKYRDPAEIFGKSVEVNRELGLPFAIAETGSGLVPGDDGSERARWLGEVAEYLSDNAALWVQYFDVDYTDYGHSDYRLRDAAGQAAWRDFCSA